MCSRFTRSFQDCSGGPLSVSSIFFSLQGHPIYETHYNPGVAELPRNHSLMRLLRSSTRAARASADRFLFVFRRILQVRVILQVLTHRMPKRTQIYQKQHLPAPIPPLPSRIDPMRGQPVLSTRRREIRTRRALPQRHESVMQVGPSPGREHALARGIAKGSAV